MPYVDVILVDPRFGVWIFRPSPGSRSLSIEVEPAKAGKKFELNLSVPVRGLKSTYSRIPTDFPAGLAQVQLTFAYPNPFALAHDPISFCLLESPPHPNFVSTKVSFRIGEIAIKSEPTRVGMVVNPFAS